MKSSLKIRVTLFLVVALIVVIGSFLFVNNRQQNRAMIELFDESSEDVVWALSKNIEFMMVNGANEEIQPILEQSQQRGTVSDISIINEDKIIARASNRSELNRKSDDRLWDILMRDIRDTTFESTINGEPVVLSYKVFENKKACQDCHDVDAAKVLGGLKMVKSRQAAAVKMAENSRRVILLALIGGLLLVGGIVWILSRSIFAPLEQVQGKLEAAAVGDINQDVETTRTDEIGRLLRSIASLMEYIKGFAGSARQIAGGDLRVTVHPRSERDELAQSFNTMTGNLTAMIQGLTDHCGQLVSTATEIAASADQLSQGAGNQSGEVSEVSSAVQEMTAAIVESSQNAASASDLAKAASETAGEGGQIISVTIHGIQRMADAARGSSESVARLAGSVEQINEVITVIDSIADQTNLLALNAAIEAARAGEQGRGFAVVADEVRKLAERTGKATGEIVEMIKAVHSETQAAVDSMSSMQSETDKNRQLTDKAGDSLREIVNMSQRVMDVIQQIAAASEQQSVTAEHIAKSIDHISSVTTETAHGAAQSADAANGLHRLAEDIKQMMGRFKIASTR